MIVSAAMQFQIKAFAANAIHGCGPINEMHIQLWPNKNNTALTINLLTQKCQKTGFAL